MNLPLLLVALVAAQRLFELRLSKRNLARAKARGAIEAGASHFPAMVALHSCFLLCCAAEILLLQRRPPWPWAFVALAALGAAQLLRYWAIATLGDRWTVRIVVLPDAPPVREGPYRWLRHPNYLAVVVELLCLPLACGAYFTAIVFTLANAFLLRIRIREEEHALGEGWAAAFAKTPRLVPELRR